MGGQSTSTQVQQSQTAPWAPAQPMLQGILGQLNANLKNTGLTATESDAFRTLQNNAALDNPYEGQIGGYAQSLFNGGGANAQAGNVQDNLAALKAQLTPYANGSMIGNNPALAAQLAQIRTDVGNDINSQFAAAGRDFSGANQMAYARGVAAAEAPILAAQYNQDVDRQLNAANALHSAGNSTANTLAGMQQTCQSGAGHFGGAIRARRAKLWCERRARRGSAAPRHSGSGTQPACANRRADRAAGATEYDNDDGDTGDVGSGAVWDHRARGSES